MFWQNNGNTVTKRAMPNRLIALWVKRAETLTHGIPFDFIELDWCIFSIYFFVILV